MNTTAVPGVLHVLEQAIEQAESGAVGGVTVILYGHDWSWKTSNAGSVLRLPSIGIAAAHLLAGQFERRLRHASGLSLRTDRRV